MKTKRPVAITPLEPPTGLTYSIDEVARMTRTSRHTIGIYCRRGIIAPVNTPDRGGWYFDDEAICVLNRTERLRREHGINTYGAAIIIQLLNQIEALEEEIRFLRNAP